MVDRSSGGSSVLVTGTAGTGKSSIAASFLAMLPVRGERAVYFAFEESPSQILRNMRSLGLRLDRWIKAGLLKIISVRPTSMGLENHLASMCQQIDDLRPNVAAIDPITNLIAVGTQLSVKAMLTRLIDLLKGARLLPSSTNLSTASMEQTSTEILMDTDISVEEIPSDSSRKRFVDVLKARG